MLQCGELRRVKVHEIENQYYLSEFVLNETHNNN